MNIKFYWHKYKYFSYEKYLAEREIIELCGVVPKPFDNGLEVDKAYITTDNLYRFTYFEKIVINSIEEIIPNQSHFEFSSKSTNQFNRLSKQNTRYSAHGIHEYKGKFNPQIIRFIGNLIGLQSGEWIIDPFCGSGTTLLESLHNKWNAIGIDRNPLAIFVANAKITAIKLKEDCLNDMKNSICESLLFRIGNVNLQTPLQPKDRVTIAGKYWNTRLPDFEYLSKWFIQDVLVQVSIILQEIHKLPCPELKLVAKVILSDIIRNISLQDPSDLRIRRRKNFPESVNVIEVYIKQLQEKIANIINAQKHINLIDNTRQLAILGDVRTSFDTLNDISGISIKQLSAAITSPPYATGLPYVDTDRLSLVLLGLIGSDEINSTQKSLIGNREIAKSERLDLLLAIDENRHNLPPKTIEVCKQLKNAVGYNDGFRKQNVPSVIYKYLSEMAIGFEQVLKILKTNAPYVLVVGNNTTTLGGKKYTIDTPQLLIDIAISRGFKLIETIDLDTYHRYDIHKTNSIRSESLVLLST